MGQILSGTVGQILAGAVGQILSGTVGQILSGRALNSNIIDAIDTHYIRLFLKVVGCFLCGFFCHLHTPKPCV